MYIKVLRAKLHRVKVTGKNVYYQGSITIGRCRLEKSGIIPGEFVYVVNLSNGARFETYVIEGRDKEIELNGGAARLGEIGDELIIMAYAYVTPEEAKSLKPIVIYGDDEACKA